MNWMFKALVQNSVALLPDPWSHRVYYAMQRRFGGLKAVSAVDKIKQGVELAALLREIGRDVHGASFLEVGTGRRLNLPLSLWLLGAERVVTIDLNPYLKEELVREDVAQIRAQRDAIVNLFGAQLCLDRLDRVAALADDFRLDALLDTCSIRYIAPGDAASTGLAAGSIDFHVSYEVLEHIPEPVLQSILEEGSRVVAKDGLFLHKVDFSDHFSHSDMSISKINFLRYSERAFAALAGNRYMYMNRLRVDDFLRLYERSGHRVLKLVAQVDAETASLLEKGALEISDRFKSKSVETLSTMNAWIVSRGRHQNGD
jgi:methyltransferase family protein